MESLTSALPKLLDLASNFNIDLSGILSQYAEKLKTQDCSFPEAALLIQQCSEIYGRKVDYLHSLVVELSETMNSRVYQSGGNKEDVEVSPRKEASQRKRKTAALMTTEDFTKQTIRLDKPKIIKKTKKSKTCCREPICVSLLNQNLQNKTEFHIYEDEFVNIGIKNQFRINWRLQQSCRLEENIMKTEDQNLWANQSAFANEVTDTLECGEDHVGGGPEYNEDNVDGGSEENNARDGLDGPETCILEEMSTTKAPPLSGVENSAMVEQEPDQLLGINFTMVENKPVDDVQKPKKCSKSTFKLPFQLTKKGSRGAKPESNYTLFLFSNMLKRALKMKSALPPLFKERNVDKKLIAKHISFMKKRYDLENRIAVSRSLIEIQGDFLGFEDVLLEEVPDVLGAIGLGDPNEIDELNPSLTDCDGQDNTNGDDDGWENPDIFVSEDPRIDYSKKIRTTVDVAAVADWRAHIQEKLTEEDDRRKFDVHEYGSDILNKFNGVGETISFGQVVAGLDPGEVSRYFLSTLMLANTSNLLIGDCNGQPNTLEMTLQHVDRSHAMEDFLVPPAVGGDFTKDSPVKPHSKRKSHTDRRDVNPPKRFLKQMPGVGPWKNKSKRN